MDEYRPQAPDLLKEETLVAPGLSESLEDTMFELTHCLNTGVYRDHTEELEALYGRFSAALTKVELLLEGVETQAYSNFQSRRYNV